MPFDKYGDYLEETDEEYFSRLEREGEIADQAYAEMLAYCSGCRFFLHGSCNRDIDQYPHCIRVDL